MNDRKDDKCTGKKSIPFTSGKHETSLKRQKGTDYMWEEKGLVIKQAFQQGSRSGKFQSQWDHVLEMKCSGEEWGMGYEGVISQLSQSLKHESWGY